MASSWAWSLTLIALTIAAHATGIVMITIALTRLRNWLVRPGHIVRQPGLLAVILVATVGVLLAVLHGAEAVCWALTYLWLGAVSSPADAMLYSFDSITTRGASGVVLRGEWQLMGALEAADGMLLFGVSTAFVFSMIERILPMIIAPDGRRRRGR